VTDDELLAHTAAPFEEWSDPLVERYAKKPGGGKQHERTDV
jgi:hypothetical protein